jgi:hypothetical protein
MLQVHIGALTLRMAPCALSELTATLYQAEATLSARRFGDAGAPSPLAMLRHERGEA